MTQGESVFYLREMHGHWTTTTVSSEKLGELANAKLIEMRPVAGTCIQVRLTHVGQQRKIDGRSHYKTTLSLANTRRMRSARRNKDAPKAKPLA